MRKSRKPRLVFSLVAVLVSCSFLYAMFQGIFLWKFDQSSAALESASILPPSLTRPTTTTSSSASGMRYHPPRRRWAYAFLMAACDPKFPEQYIGILYSVLVAAHNLRGGDTTDPNSSTGTTADILLLVQLSSETTATSLSNEEERLLRAMDIRIHYLPKPKGKSLVNFYTIQFEKFRILELIDYSRVLMMDGDVMPFCNLDYLFELSEPPPPLHETNSEPPMLKENVILAWKNAPSHGGFFLLKPGPGEYQKIAAIIREREQKALTMPFPHFDAKEGWGHVIGSTTTNPSDRVRFFRDKNDRISEWDWYGVFAEQGLLYYWVKYVKRHVSIVIGGEVENWGPAVAGNSNDVRLEQTFTNLSNYACLPAGKEKPGSYGFIDNGFRRQVPYVDFAHFTGDSKPWEHPPKKSFPKSSTMEEVKSAEEFWFHVLRKLKRKLNITVDIENLTTRPPPVGRFYTHKKMAAALRAKAGELQT